MGIQAVPEYSSLHDSISSQQELFYTLTSFFLDLTLPLSDLLFPAIYTRGDSLLQNRAIPVSEWNFLSSTTQRIWWRRAEQRKEFFSYSYQIGRLRLLQNAITSLQNFPFLEWTSLVWPMKHAFFWEHHGGDLYLPTLPVHVVIAEQISQSRSWEIHGSGCHWTYSIPLAETLAPGGRRVTKKASLSEPWRLTF